MSADDFARALRVVMNLLPDHGVTEQLIREYADDAVVLLRKRGGDPPDLDELVRHVESLVVIRQDPASSLVDNKGHVEWLRDRRAEAAWDFWDRYRQYLEDVQFQPRQVVLRLDEVTDSILGKLEDPTREGPWDRRGLVVGQVQSGKTSNYTGLTCKAADAGYKLIVVLAGIHNSLRSQTQLRLDEGFLGSDSQHMTRGDDSQRAIGAGALAGFARLKAGTLTTSADNGDFRVAQARKLGLPVGDYPVLLVVKKHAKIIKYIHDWVTSMHADPDPATGRSVVRDVPLLVIDDEADNASIDTNKEEAGTPTAINREIRRLLHAFDKSAYVGYTATPYANIYADPYEDHDDFGEDIFPRSFIESLQAPSNYFGPQRVFGLTEDGRGPIPIHTAIDDFEEWMPVGHKKDWEPQEEDLPASLRNAMLDFLLTCAARRARGQVAVHNSMLIHVTRFQDVQEQVTEQVRNALLFVKDRIRHGDGGSGTSILDELEERWRATYEPATAWFKAADDSVVEVGWDAVRTELLPAVERIQIRTMNGNSRDALDYYEHRATGLSVIAIGGDKLSRGLTLEGLSVSYYLRASRMYDTLMQMGRWFGYRPGYEDLCRLYTTSELRAWYREITLASDELRQELEEMAAHGATPIEYGLRVRTSPAGLSVTAANKSRRGSKVRLSFSGGNPETVLFDVRPRVLDANLDALDGLVRSLRANRQAATSQEKGNHLWTGEGVNDAVVAFLEAYRSDPMAWRVRPDLIAQYVRRCSSVRELSNMTVALISNQANEARADIAGIDIGLTTRSLMSDGEDGKRQHELRTDHRYAIRRILSPPDETLDMTEAQTAAALAATIADYHRNPGRRKAVPTDPSGPELRRMRTPDRALMLIYVLDNAQHAELVSRPMVGFFLSFPHSRHDVAAEYLVNPVWQQLQAQGVADDEDEE
ncbi:Z1 domain-containing protein [Geodermatophilus obscurus]|uniref:Putative endonuclease, Z1 domain protein n=1 Tax=Geodermatophilus obscurus (strain ATCC 25078 / DSM 43160 / JCM 3152 / CCUG 61914 / KCC A-0152 / KCTC 9177 / NBRC 13315 / NRRL B-3577 / G-20) TaxID=526225 RepID=D2S8A1_GEOOG|nr:Z1 domain-containing protein [Geodermatophilus obscurus]ADB73523.1 Putative endonuclease, Z1 domain protein [Geodermatophilus obscurus DSM 43160]